MISTIFFILCGALLGLLAATIIIGVLSVIGAIIGDFMGFIVNLIDGTDY